MRTMTTKRTTMLWCPPLFPVKLLLAFLVWKCIFIESVTKIKNEKMVPARICDYGCDHQHGHHQLVVKVKSSRYRPGVVQTVPGGLGSQIFMAFGTWRWWGRQPQHRPPLPPGVFLVLIFTGGWVDPRDMVRSEGNRSLKIPVTPPGINPMDRPTSSAAP